MRTRYVVVVSLGVKVGILLLCLSLLYVHKMMGQGMVGYFNVTMSPDQQWQSVRENIDRDQTNNEGLTGMMFAAVNGQLDLAKALFAYGANLNVQSTKEHQTALHFATNNMRSIGSQNVGYYLVDVYADTMIKNIYGQIPLHLVLSTDVNADRIKMIEYLVKNGSDINARTGQGDTLIHLVANMSNTELMEALLNQWASIIDLNVKNDLGLTPYQYAVQQGFEGVKLLLDKTYPKVTKATDRDTNGLTGLMLAIMRNDMQAVNSMAHDMRAVNLRSDDRYANTALHIAMAYQNAAAAMALIATADLTIKNARGEVPAYFLVRVFDVGKKLRIAAALLAKAPQSILILDDLGNTLLHWIIQYNDTPLLEYLIAHYKPLVQQAMFIKNKALEGPKELIAKMNRVQIDKMLLAIR